MKTIAVDLGGTIIKTGLLEEGNLLEFYSEKSISEGGLKSNLALIEKMIIHLFERRNIELKNIVGIGFSFPGLVDSVRNKVLSTNKKYDDAPKVDLPKWANEMWNLPLYLENDARMALLGEWQFGAGKGSDNIIMVTLGTGIGSAVLIEGKVLKGKHFQAGNLCGHFTVNHRGTVCTCGNVGCMESEASTWKLPELITNHSLYKSSSLKNEELLDYEALFKNAAQEDPLAKQVLDHCFSVWSSGLISMIHAFDPEIIILGGGIMKSAPVILQELQKRIDNYAWTPWGNIKLLKAENINTAGLFGADYLVKTNVLKST